MCVKALFIAEIKGFPEKKIKAKEKKNHPDGPEVAVTVFRGCPVSVVRRKGKWVINCWDFWVL